MDAFIRLLSGINGMKFDQIEANAKAKKRSSSKMYVHWSLHLPTRSVKERERGRDGDRNG